MKVVYLDCGFKESLRCAIFVKKMFSLLRPPTPPKKNKNKQTNKKDKKKHNKEKKMKNSTEENIRVKL